MYRSTRQQYALTDFNQPLGLELKSSNRWVQLASIIPWEHIETEYAAQFESTTGNSSAPLRLVLGALLIQQHYSVSDRELVMMIQENPYLQYFCGSNGFDDDDLPFVASALAAFRKRLAPLLEPINEEIIKPGKALLEADSTPGSEETSQASDEEAVCGENNAEDKEQDASDDSDDGTLPNQPGSEGSAIKEAAPEEDPAQKEAGEDAKPKCRGTLILDAACCLANIRFPQDTSLLNAARSKTEALLTELHEQCPGEKKPRTYRLEAASEYKTFVLKRRHTRKEIRRQIRKQLNWLKRDLKHIEAYLANGCVLKAKQLELLETLRKVHDQQREMYNKKTHRVDDRIVSISQLWVRPIVRGKAQAPTEFGIKAHLTLSDDFACLDHSSFNAFNESTLLQEVGESYRNREGHYPE